MDEQSSFRVPFFSIFFLVPFDYFLFIPSSSHGSIPGCNGTRVLFQVSQVDLGFLALLKLGRWEADGRQGVIKPS